MTWVKLTSKALYLMQGGITEEQFLETVELAPKEDGTGTVLSNQFELVLPNQWFANDDAPGTMAISWKVGQVEPTKLEPPLPPPGAMATLFTVNLVSKIFFDAPLKNIQRFLPTVLKYLEEVGLTDKTMILMALATIRVETAGFAPISEFVSEFNTDPGAHPFNRYDFRKADLGNNGVGEGARFKGRGFIQLTGRANYEKYDARIGLGGKLVSVPDLANDPDVAARLLAEFLKDAEKVIRKALQVDDFETARKAVNGGTHGSPEFIRAYEEGRRLVA